MEELLDESNKKLKMDPCEDNCNDVEPLSGEYVLRDIMDNICHYLNIYELSQVAQVCKSWNNEVRREIDKRYLQCKVFPFLHSNEISNPSFHVSKILDTMPCVTLLFPGTNYRLNGVRDEVELELDIYNVYRKQFPNILAVVGVSVAMINEQLIHSLPMESFNGIVDSRYAPAGILGICLPKNKRLTVKQAYVRESELYVNRIEFPELMQYYQNKFEAMIDSLKPGSLDYKSVILIFVSNANDWSTEFMLQIFKKCYTGKPCTLWGLATDYNIYGSSTSADMIPDMIPNNGREHDIRYIALELSGPDLESWSTVIEMTVSVHELENELREFRNRIHLKRCTIGFLCAPIVPSDLSDEIRVDFDDEELVEIVKKIFPDITFISTFGGHEDYYFGIDSINGSTDDPISRMDIMSLLVLTYD